MTFAQIKLLVPNTLPNRREALNSIASVTMPLVNTVAYNAQRLKGRSVVTKLPFGTNRVSLARPSRER